MNSFYHSEGSSGGRSQSEPHLTRAAKVMESASHKRAPGNPSGTVGVPEGLRGLLLLLPILLLGLGAAAWPGNFAPAVFDSVADMVSRGNPKAFTQRTALLLGYTTPGDGGGGTVYGTNTITSTNVGSRIASSQSGWSWQRTEAGRFTVKQFGAVGDGLVDDHAAIAALAAAQDELILPSGTYLLGSAFTLASTKTFRFSRGAILKPASAAAVLTISGGINATDEQVFDCSAGGGGSVKITYNAHIPEVPITWFGAERNNGQQIDLPWLYVHAAVSASGPPIKFPVGVYNVDNELKITNRVQLRGVMGDRHPMSQLNFRAPSTGKALFLVGTNLDNVTFDGLLLNNTTTSGTQRRASGIRVAAEAATHATTQINLLNSKIQNFTEYGFYSPNSYYVRIDRCSFANNQNSWSRGGNESNTAVAIQIDFNANALEISGSKFNENDAVAVLGSAGTVNFQGNTFELNGSKSGVSTRTNFFATNIVSAGAATSTNLVTALNIVGNYWEANGCVNLINVTNSVSVSIRDNQIHGERSLIYYTTNVFNLNGTNELFLVSGNRISGLLGRVAVNNAEGQPIIFSQNSIVPRHDRPKVETRLQLDEWVDGPFDFVGPTPNSFKLTSLVGFGNRPSSSTHKFFDGTAIADNYFTKINAFFQTPLIGPFGVFPTAGPIQSGVAGAGGAGIGASAPEWHFGFTGREVVLEIAGGCSRFLVNGEDSGAVYDHPDDGTFHLLTFRFPTEEYKTMAVIGKTYFYGAYLPHTNAWTAHPVQKKKKLVVLGDSFVEAGVDNTTQVGGIVTRMAELLPAFQVIGLGEGGTGLLSPGANGRTNYLTRFLNDVVPLAPDALLVLLSVNDMGYSGAQIYSETTNLFHAITNSLPTTKVFAAGPLWPRYADPVGDASVYTAANNWSNGVIYRGVTNVINNISEPWVTGNVNTPGSGNAVWITSSDQTHPSAEGSKFLGRRLVQEMKRLQPGFFAEALDVATLRGRETLELKTLDAPQLSNGIAYETASLTYAATTDIDVNVAPYRTLTLGGNVTFTTSNRAAGKSVTLLITADGSSRNFTFPAWRFVGAAAPASIAASKTAVLTIFFTDATDANAIASYAVQP